MPVCNLAYDVRKVENSAVIDRFIHLMLLLVIIYKPPYIIVLKSSFKKRY